MISTKSSSRYSPSYPAPAQAATSSQLYQMMVVYGGGVDVAIAWLAWIGVARRRW
jgi:hypothetical protein